MGREQLESWGRKRRGVNNPRDGRGHVQETTKEEAIAAAERKSSGASEMSISQEILVLDLGDDQSPQYREKSGLEANNNYYTNSELPSELMGSARFCCCCYSYDVKTVDIE